MLAKLVSPPVPAATAASEVSFFACFIDSEVTSADFFAIELLDCFFRSGVVGHLHKGETFRASGIAICDDLNGFNFANLAEHVTKVSFSGPKGQISNVDFFCHSDSIRADLALGLFEPNRNLIRSTLERMWERIFRRSETASSGAVSWRNVLKEPKVTVRYLGFQALSDGSRRFDFSFSGTDGSLQIINVEAPYILFSGPDRMAIQECAGICYETLKCRVVGCSETVPASISLTSADITQHRKPARRMSGRRPNP
jgi:hypothetical protein